MRVDQIVQPHGAPLGDVDERIDRGVCPERGRQPRRIAIEGVQQARPRAFGPAKTQYGVDGPESARQVPLESEPAVGLPHALVKRQQYLAHRGTVARATLHASDFTAARLDGRFLCLDGGTMAVDATLPRVSRSARCPPRPNKSAARSKTTSRPGRPTTRSCSSACLRPMRSGGIRWGLRHSRAWKASSGSGTSPTRTAVARSSHGSRRSAPAATRASCGLRCRCGSRRSDRRSTCPSSITSRLMTKAAS